MVQSLIYQTDPSGGILQHHARRPSDSSNMENVEDSFKTTTGISRRENISQGRNEDTATTDNSNRNSIQSQVMCVVGGSTSLQRRLHKRINQGMAKFEQRQRQQQQRRSNSRDESSLADRIANLAKILIKEMGNTENKAHRNKNRKHNDELSSPLYPLEVVVVSPRLGCHRLDGEQLQAIQELINGDG